MLIFIGLAGRTSSSQGIYSSVSVREYPVLRNTGRRSETYTHHEADSRACQMSSMIICVVVTACTHQTMEPHKRRRVGAGKRGPVLQFTSAMMLPTTSSPLAEIVATFLIFAGSTGNVILSSSPSTISLAAITPARDRGRLCRFSQPLVSRSEVSAVCYRTETIQKCTACNVSA